MRNRSKGWMIAAIVVALLFVIGFVDGLMSSNPFNFLLPIIVLGGIFLLYKFPPSFLRRGSSGGYAKRDRNPFAPRKSAPAKSKKDKSRSRTVPFRVIEGGKDDDDTPKYH
ncbi:hypothetical protein RB620_16700 [Paenibacillus sp. LHD-117]|uniref:hypothetical protein n=1 Tax=Paenibacillus sp. LHD-117 TaxID=3071412 RepID=UPI0027DEB78A|nr:hypothetical protein [Paenibacillus sp. LHD-117]MDQ6421069.1 hypothetical protein [Paenibacillus sp. LHD-117]